MLYKVLLFLAIITYILYKVGSFFFRAGAISQQMRQQKEQGKGPAKRRGDGKIKGGDYVDYEEVR